MHQTIPTRMKRSWLLVCGAIFVLHALQMHSTAVFARAYYLPMKATCSASLPAHLEPEVSDHQQRLLAQILPPVTSDRPIARCELRAPVHTPCQLKPYPHLKSFYDERLGASIANFEIKPFAQPPHLVFFDEQHGIVKVIPVGSDWTSFQLRDTILTHMASSRQGS